MTKLLVFLEEVTNYIDSGYPVDLIYLDFMGTPLVEVVGASCLQVSSDILPVPSWLGTELPRSERPSCS